VMPDRFFRLPIDAVRKQSSSNRQGGEDLFDTTDAKDLETAEEFVAYLDQVEALYASYESLVDKDVSRELARIGLPTSQFTQWYWKCDLHNILRFLKLRLDAHAQKEIREYAQAMHDLIAPIVPVTMEAWRDYHMESMRLTRLEIDAIADLARGGAGELDSDNTREVAEWHAKQESLGLGSKASAR